MQEKEHDDRFLVLKPPHGHFKKDNEGQQFVQHQKQTQFGVYILCLEDTLRLFADGVGGL